MLEPSKLRHLSSILDQSNWSGRKADVLGSYVRDNIEPGQAIYTFDNNSDGLTRLTYVGSYTNLNGSQSHVLTSDTSRYQCQFIHHHFMRELLFGSSAGKVSFPNTALYICERVARRELKKHIEKKAQKALSELGGGGA